MGSVNKFHIAEGGSGLGNQSLLDKIDKLRALNVGTGVPLPQLVVVGDQSSGKSSVLESLTGFSFPRAAGLCTRYATQITCRREAQEYIDISIIPRPSATEAEQTRLRAFKPRISAKGREEFGTIFDQANREMGIRRVNSIDTSLSAFSEHILKVEICGPNQDHLRLIWEKTVIDVPGLFRIATPGLTTDSDIELVNSMVKRYMKDPRTIILAVIPSNVDVATQEIIKLAKAADPDGIRTMGVLTKPDLAIERATQQAVIDLVEGKRKDLKLGYCVVLNRKADDNMSSLQQRYDTERAFFQNDPWPGIAKTGRTGIDALKSRLRELLLSITKKEFPHVKAEIIDRLKRSREQLEGFGAPRGGSHAQRAYLGRLASEFQRIVTCALDANYVHDSLFENSELRLITRIISLNEEFAHHFWEQGHWRKFDTPSGEDEELDIRIRDEVAVPDAESFPELSDIVVEDSIILAPHKGDIKLYIQSVYENSRGLELGTFGGTVLGTVFREQSDKWHPLVTQHVSRAILIVHEFIESVLAKAIADDNVRKALWEELLVEKLCQAYKRAMQHAEFLIDIERNAKPYTYNHYFASNLNKRKVERLKQAFDECVDENEEEEEAEVEPRHKRAITFEMLRNMTIDKSNAEQVRDDIHDILMSYYKVARKRFVDAICQQVVDHFLLNGKRNGKEEEKSPLKIFDPDLVMSLDDDKLETIAGEDPGDKHQREVLAVEIKNLEAAVKVLRG